MKIIHQTETKTLFIVPPNHLQKECAGEDFEIYSLPKTADGIEAAEHIPTYYMDRYAAQSLCETLTQTEDESAVYLTGVVDGHRHVITSFIPVELAHASSVRAIGDAKSCSDKLIRLNKDGLQLLGVAHSHPGKGARSVNESETDVAYIRDLEAANSKAIGIIVSRDYHLHFFSANREFQAELQGDGIEEVNPNTFKIHELK